MSDLPLPLPDRRTLAKSSKQQNNKFDKNKFSKKEMEQMDSDNKNTINSEIQEGASLSLVKLKQIEDMRQKILNYKLLTEQSIFFTQSNSYT